MAVMDEKLSEAKQIELLRRRDIAIAAVRLASELFIYEELLNKQVRVALQRGKWLWGIFLLGCLISWFIGKDSNSYLNLGGYIAGLCLLVSVVNGNDILYFSRQLKLNNIHILLAVSHWETMGCLGSLHEIKRFIKDDCFDNKSERYREWISEQYGYILIKLNMFIT